MLWIGKSYTRDQSQIISQQLQKKIIIINPKFLYIYKQTNYNKQPKEKGVIELPTKWTQKSKKELKINIKLMHST